MARRKERAPSISEARVYRNLKKAILSGVFQHGFLLIQDDLCRRFRASRTPIRDALTHLQAEGLAVAMPNKGVFVRELTAKDVHELYEVRLLLESAAAKRAAAKADKLFLSDMLEEVVRLSRRSDLTFDSVSTIGAKLHRFIIDSSENGIMKEILDHIGSLVELSRTSLRETADRIREINEEHITTIQALIRNDGEMAADLMRAHLKLSREAHLKLLLGFNYDQVDRSGKVSVTRADGT